MICKPQGQPHNRGGRIGVTAGWEHAGARQVEVFRAKHATIRVYDAGCGIRGHAGRADMVLGGDVLVELDLLRRIQVPV